jgi:hypothetical protein
MAANLPLASMIMLTERSEAFAALASRVAEQGGKASQVHAAVLDWRNYMPAVTGSVEQCGVTDDTAGGAFDVVIGSDLAWNAETCASLPWIWSHLLLNAKRDATSTTILYGHWLRSPKPLAELLLCCQEAGVALLPFDLAADHVIASSITTDQYLTGPSLADAATHTPNKGELLIGHCSSTDASLACPDVGVSGSVADSASDVDWFQEIFDDGDSLPEIPIFQVYRVGLCTDSLAQEKC